MDEKRFDPAEKTAQMFPEDFLIKTAKETGAFKRKRKIDVIVLFWFLVLNVGVNFQREIRVMKRRYEAEANVELSISSFYSRFTPQMVEFLRMCVMHSIETQAQETRIQLGEKLNDFKDLLIQDSTIIRLHESLAKIWPAARSRKVAAGVKVSCLVSAVANTAKSVAIYAERTAEIKTLKIGPWIRNRILLIDLGFFKYGIFHKIDKHGGYFVSRLKGNANPMIVKVNRIDSADPTQLEGKKIKDVLPSLKGGVLDATVEIKFRKGKYNGKRKTETRLFRLVAILNNEMLKYHIYLTNIPDEILKAEDIAALYSARWEIEIAFKELKTHYHIDMIPSKNPNIIKCMIWISILTMMCSRHLHTLVRNVNPENAYRYTRLRWAKVYMEHADKLMDWVFEYMGIRLTFMDRCNLYFNQPIDPNVNRKHLMDEWIE